MKKYTINQKENKLNIHLDDNDNLWFNNNIFIMQYNNNNINIILCNNNIIFLLLDDIKKIIKIKSKIKQYKYSFILSDNFFHNNTIFVDLNDITIADINFKKWIDNIKSIIYKNKSHLFTVEIQNKTCIKIKNNLRQLLR